MTIKIYNLNNFKAHPKPRGQLSGAGKMTHSLGGYRDWQNECIVRLKTVNFKLPDTFYAIVYIFYWSKQNKGRLPDGGNLRGGMEDALVKGELIKDDNVGILPRNYDNTVRFHRNAVQILIPEGLEDMIYIMRHETRFHEMLDN